MVSCPSSGESVRSIAVTVRSLIGLFIKFRLLINSTAAFLNAAGLFIGFGNRFCLENLLNSGVVISILTPRAHLSCFLKRVLTLSVNSVKAIPMSSAPLRLRLNVMPCPTDLMSSRLSYALTGSSSRPFAYL